MVTITFKNSAGLAGYAQSKGVPSPKAAVIVTGILMLLGGLGIVLGIFPRLAVLLLEIFLIPTTFKMHQYWENSRPYAKNG
jgi:putative oxidoreductase